MRYDTCIISGGASRGFYALGIIAKHWKDLDLVNKYAGTSVGSMICLLLICGYGVDEIFRMSLDIKMEYPSGESINLNLSGVNSLLLPYLAMITPWIERVSNLLSKNGVMDENPYITAVEKMVKARFGKIPTLLELYKLTGKKLVTVGSCISTYDPAYFSYEEFPDMPCTLAVDISCRVPFLFTPVIYNNHLFVDGGISDHFPIIEAEGKTLAICMKGVEIGTLLQDKNVPFVRYFWLLVNTSTKGKYNNICSDDDLTLYIIKGPGGSMSTTPEEAINMYNVGFSSNPEQRSCSLEAEY